MSLAKVVSLGVLPTALSAGGAASSFDVSTVMQTAVDSTQAQMFSVLAIVVPAIIAIVGAVVAIKFGLNWFKRIRG